MRQEDKHVNMIETQTENTYETLQPSNFPFDTGSVPISLRSLLHSRAKLTSLARRCSRNASLRHTRAAETVAGNRGTEGGLFSCGD